MNISTLSNIWIQLKSVVTELLFNTEGTAVTHLNCSDGTSIGPYSLVQFAYRGGLAKQGIPRQFALLKAHRTGRISVDILVKQAVKAGLVSITDLTNSAYLDAVETGFLFHYLLHPRK